jgi:thiosulfate/3-mercaptopyruvate sulfurtransferase
MPWLINAAQLDKFRKNQKNLMILDASFHQGDRNAKQEFLEKHIIDARFFDIDAFSDPSSATCHSHMLLSDEKRTSEIVGNLGIRNDYKIILYDTSELHSACRALWMFKMFGHSPNLLYILDGGFKAWEKFDGKTEAGEPTIAARAYTAHFQSQFIRTLEQIKANLKIPMAQIIDMRHAVRYAGGAETRPNIRSGHIPGSFCFPSSTMFDKEGNFLALEKIRRKLIDIGVDLRAPIITSCGSGITASILNFVLDLMSHPQHALYNGSWTEWGAEKLYANEKTLAERPISNCIDSPNLF